MAKKERPLTERQIEALKMAESTLFGDMKLVDGFGRSIRGLVNRGLISGCRDNGSLHFYLTDKGAIELGKLL